MGGSIWYMHNSQFNLHHQNQLIWPSIHSQGVGRDFKDSLDQCLKVEVVESMGYVVATLFSAQGHLRKDLALLVHQGQQLRYVFCRIEGVAGVHHLQNPTKFSSDQFLFQTEADECVPQLTKS